MKPFTVLKTTNLSLSSKNIKLKKSSSVMSNDKKLNTFITLYQKHHQIV